MPKKKHVLYVSHVPEKGKTNHPEIKPGLYVLLSNKNTQREYLLPTQSGHGHKYLAHLINREENRPDDDDSWVGAAGEKIIGRKHQTLGLSFHTGSYHEKLDITEPSSDAPNYEELMRTYLDTIKQKAEEFNQPSDCLFLASEWEEVVFKEDNRAILFTPAGAYRKITPGEAGQVRQQLGLPLAPNSSLSKTQQLLEKLVQTAVELTQREAAAQQRFFTPQIPQRQLPVRRKARSLSDATELLQLDPSQQIEADVIQVLQNMVEKIALQNQPQTEEKPAPVGYQFTLFGYNLLAPLNALVGNTRSPKQEELRPAF